MSKKEYHQVFMYGSNLDRERLSSRIPNWNGQFRRAFLPGHELRFNKNSQYFGVAANIMPHLNRQVWGILVEFDERDLELMDEYEGCPHHYERKQVNLVIEFGDRTLAHVYIAHQQKIISEMLPHPEYLEYVIRGGLECNLPKDYINAIEALGRGIA
jgi:gamma-glutamylcyclotransferase (GGCT)/AIG2-like uncharacterized protein YtfP